MILGSYIATAVTVGCDGRKSDSSQIDDELFVSGEPGTSKSISVSPFAFG